ncbi:MAG: ComF family protein [Kiritimatiellae bacterium]|nr:ComF family protein [Kiritimatiellia bacterium]
MLNAFMDVIFPRSCAGCGGEVGGSSEYLCWNCLVRLEWIRPPFCQICGDPLDGAVSFPVVCAGCTARLPAFERARSVARFRGILRAILHDFKYRGATWLSRDLVVLLRACYEIYFARAGLDTVTYVPLYPARERERSYNQALLLAQGLAAACPALVLRTCLRRIRPTPSQTHLTAGERIANVKAMFSIQAPRDTAGRRILLVDDVMTTGATVNECARMLKQAGAALVGVLTVGRG